MILEIRDTIAYNPPQEQPFLENDMSTIRITTEELYEKIWTTPTTKLARR
jgi:hypothetical protein